MPPPTPEQEELARRAMAAAGIKTQPSVAAPTPTRLDYNELAQRAIRNQGVSPNPTGPSQSRIAFERRHGLKPSSPQPTSRVDAPLSALEQQVVGSYIPKQEQQAQQAGEAPGALETAGRAAASTAFPSAIAGLAGIGTQAVGALTTPLTGPFGVLLGYGASIPVSIKTYQKAAEFQDWITTKLTGSAATSEVQQKLAKGREAHPVASFIGEVIPGTIGMKWQSPKSLMNAISGAAKNNRQAQLQLTGLVVQAGIMNASEAYQQIKEGKFEPTRLFLALLWGGVISRPADFISNAKGRSIIQWIRRTANKSGISVEELNKLSKSMQAEMDANRQQGAEQQQSPDAPAAVQDATPQPQESVTPDVQPTATEPPVSVAPTKPPLYRETNIKEAAELFPSSNGSETLPFGYEEKHVATHPDLALGQGSNKGVIVEMDSSNLNFQERRPVGQPESMTDMGAQGVVKVKGTESLRPHVRSITVKPGAVGDKISNSRFALFAKQALAAGWTKEKLPDGSTKYTRPTPSADPAAVQAEAPTATQDQVAAPTEAAQPKPSLPEAPPPLPREVPEGYHEQRTVKRAAEADDGKGPLAEEAQQARESGEAFAKDTPIKKMADEAKIRADTEPDAVLLEARATKDPFERAAKLTGYINSQTLKGKNVSAVFDELADDASVAGTVLRFMRELKVGTPDGRASLHMRTFEKWLTRNKTDVATDAKAAIKKLFSTAEAMPEGTAQNYALNAAIAAAVRAVPRGRFLWTAYRYSNALSNPRSHLRNITSNLIQISGIRPAILLARGNPIEAARYMGKSIASIGDGFDAMKAAWSHGDPSVRLDLNDTTPFDKAMQDRLPAALTVVGRSMEAADKFFSTIMQTAETDRLIRRGMTPEAAHSEASALAERYLFRDKLGTDAADKSRNLLSRAFDEGGVILDTLRKQPVIGPVVQPVVLFLRTPTAIGKRGGELSPFGYAVQGGLSRKTVAKSRYPGKSLDKLTPEELQIVDNDYMERVGAARVGTAAMAVGSLMALAERTTWAPPKDPKERELFYASGRKPYSYKVGDKWIPMWTLGSLGFSLAIPAAMRDVLVDNPEMAGANAAEKMWDIATALGKFYGEATPFSSLNGFMEAMTESDGPQASKFLAFTSGQFIPASGLIRFINMLVDPYFRKPKNLKEAFMKDIPILSQKVGTYQDPDGQPSERTALDILPPFPVGKMNPEYEALFKERNRTLKERKLNDRELEDVAQRALTDPNARRELVTFVYAQSREEQSRLKSRVKQRFGKSLSELSQDYVEESE